MNFHNKCEVRSGPNILAIDTQVGCIYKINEPDHKVNFTQKMQQPPDKPTSKEESDIWHKRLDHLNRRDMMKLNSLAFGYSISSCNNEPCESCIKGKQSKLPFLKESQRTKGILEVIHTDICDPMEVKSLAGAKYFVTFTDEFSRYTIVYFLKEKSEVKNCLMNYVILIENQLNKKVKAIRSDNARDLSSDIQSFLANRGTIGQTSCSYTPQQNGVADGKIGHWSKKHEVS